MMKKMFFALVAMVMISASAMAQSDNNSDADRTLTFERMSSYLQLTIDQREPVKTAMAQFTASMDGVRDLKNPEKVVEGWTKVINRHKQTMKKILTEQQYAKYETLLDQSVKNNTAKYAEQYKDKQAQE